MPNSFVTTKSIARTALPRLIENLVFPNLCFKDYSEDYVAGQGDTIRVRKPVTLVAQDFTAGSDVVEQDISDSTIDVTLDKLSTVDLKFESIESATNVDDLNRLVIEPAVVALAEKINGNGFALSSKISQTCGTAGTTPDALSYFANASKVLDDAKVPMSQRFGVWNTSAMAKFRQLGDLVNADKSGATEALRAGSIGNVFGIQNYMAQGVKNHTLAGAGTVLIDKAGGFTKGATELHVDGVTTALAEGDRITIGGHSYVVASAGALSTADQDITIAEPGLLADAADNAAVTLVSSAAENLVFHQNAFAFVTRPLIAPKGVESYTTSYNGVSLRVVRGYDMQKKRDKVSIDVLYGYKVLNPDMACVVLG